MDTPQISAALLENDWDDCDAILGLSEDGGFWAIGLRTPDPDRVCAVARLEIRARSPMSSRPSKEFVGGLREARTARSVSRIAAAAN
jgi:Uncharacterized protein conserved in bacteria (DUF2064)